MRTPLNILASVVFGLGLALGLLLPPPPATAVTIDHQEPTAVIAQFHDSLLAVMKDASQLRPAQRFERLAEPVDSTFDLEGMLKIITGEYWAQASAAERQRLLQAFRDLTVSTYAARFDGYSGERFEFLNEQSGPRSTRLVNTRILGPDTEPVALTYVLRRHENGQWQIIDVLLAEGISELATRRSEYRTILKKSGPLALAATLEEKARNLVQR